MAVQVKKLTYQDYLAMPEMKQRYEIIGGLRFMSDDRSGSVTLRDWGFSRLRRCEIPGGIIRGLTGLLFGAFSLTPAVAGPLTAPYQADLGVTFAQLLQDPESYTGRVVLLGGELIRVTPGQDGNTLEILQRPLAADYRPLPYRPSWGRFLVFVPASVGQRFPEPGSLVTVVGEVRGKKERQGEPLPSLEARQVAFWPRRDQGGLPRSFSDGSAPPCPPPSPWYPWLWWPVLPQVIVVVPLDP